MISLLEKDESLVISSSLGDLGPRHQSQLAYWGFSVEKEGVCLVAASQNLAQLTEKVCNYFRKRGLEFEIDSSLEKLLEGRRESNSRLEESKAIGARYKDGSIDEARTSEFLQFLKENVPRTLKDHQIKAALHLLSVENGANFSVPGSGKTTVVLAAFEMMRTKGIVDAIFVVGPLACFAPWRDEFEEALGRSPKMTVVAGGDVDDRRSKYLANPSNVPDLYLTSFQTLHRDQDVVARLLGRQGIKFLLVVDEAHYIKQVDGAWATAALNVAPFAERRCILTGTPFPKSYRDAFNLFELLWPKSPPIAEADKRRISIYSEGGQFDRASEILNGSIGPLFYRVRKTDLALAPQIFHDPILVAMNDHERTIYDSILERIQAESQRDFFRDLDLLVRLRKGRMIRLRQCLSYPRLLRTVLQDYDEELLEDRGSLANLIQEYDQIERPGKLKALIKLVQRLRTDSEKVVIWSNFIGTLKLITEELAQFGFEAHLLYGAIPSEKSEDQNDELTRERVIKEFVDPTSGIDILVANPGVCAESISLHKTCSNAIYYDLSYNCAQYLQSLDRIHRVGGSEHRSPHYYFLQYQDTLDHDILENLLGKAKRMSKIIDQDFPVYSLDMFEDDDELAAYERLFDDAPDSV